MDSVILQCTDSVGLVTKFQDFLPSNYDFKNTPFYGYFNYKKGPFYINYVNSAIYLINKDGYSISFNVSSSILVLADSEKHAIPNTRIKPKFMKNEACGHLKDLTSVLFHSNGYFYLLELISLMKTLKLNTFELLSLALFYSFDDTNFEIAPDFTSASFPMIHENCQMLLFLNLKLINKLGLEDKNYIKNINITYDTLLFTFQKKGYKKLSGSDIAFTEITPNRRKIWYYTVPEKMFIFTSSAPFHQTESKFGIEIYSLEEFNKDISIESHISSVILVNKNNQMIYFFEEGDRTISTLFDLDTRSVRTVYPNDVLMKVEHETFMSSSLFYDASFLVDDYGFPRSCELGKETSKGLLVSSLFYCKLSFHKVEKIDKNKLLIDCKLCDKFHFRILLLLLLLFGWYPIFVIFKNTILNIINLIHMLTGGKGFFKFIGKLSLRVRRVKYGLIRPSFFESLRLISKYYFFILHVCLQILFLPIAIIKLLYYIMKNKKLRLLLIMFPFRFWFGSAEAWSDSGFVSSCDAVMDSDCGDRSTSKIDYFHCSELKGKLQYQFLDHFTKTIQFDKSVLKSEDCEGEKCSETRTYRTSISLYPCKKLKIQKLNGESIFVVVEDVDEEITYSTVEVFSPYTIEKKIIDVTCAHSLCSVHLNKLNDKDCRLDCLENLGCDADSWRDSKCYKFPFVKMLVEGTPSDNKKAIVNYNSPFDYSCDIVETACWNPLFSIYGLSKREKFVFQMAHNSRFKWNFHLIELKDIKIEYYLRILNSNEIEKFKITQKEESFRVLEDKYNVKLDRNFDHKFKYILVGFKDYNTQIFSTDVYYVTDLKDVRNYFKMSFGKTIPIRGFSEYTKYSDTLETLDKNYEQIIQDLDLRFKKSIKIDEIGIMVKRNQNSVHNYKCVSGAIKEKLEEINGKILTPAKLIGVRNENYEIQPPENLEMDSTDTKVKLVGLWKMTNEVLNQFWEVWSDSYLKYLQERYQRDIKQPHLTSKVSPKVGAIVLVAEDLQPRAVWKLAKISRLNKSRDNEVRSVEIEYANGQRTIRPITKLCPLELDIIPDVSISSAEENQPTVDDVDDYNIVEITCEEIEED